MKEVVRMVLVGCLSAMALGASFAIGFGYVWSDLGSAPTESISSLDEGASTRGATPLVEASRTPTDTAPLASSVRELPIIREAAPAKAAVAPSAASAPDEELLADPGPAFGVTLRSSIPNSRSAVAEAAPSVPANGSSASTNAPLASEPMPAVVSAAVPSIVAESPTISVIPAALPSRAGSAAESALSSGLRTDLDAVQQALARYQNAYSQKDVGAMALVWPSVDVAGVARAFENVDRQALTFNDCRVTTAGNLATAVCPGQVRYIGRVGGRQLQERQGTWTIALERNGDVWQFTRLNVR